MEADAYEKDMCVCSDYGFTSCNEQHIIEDYDVWDFELSDDEMAEIAKLDKGERYYHRTDEQLVGFAAWRPDFEKA